MTIVPSEPDEESGGVKLNRRDYINKMAEI